MNIKKRLYCTFDSAAYNTSVLFVVGKQLDGNYHQSTIYAAKCIKFGNNGVHMHDNRSTHT